MSDFKIVNNRSETQLGDSWVDSPKYSNRKIEVDEKGNKVGLGYKGRHYKLIVKERRFSGLELLGRRLLGVVLTAVSFGALLLRKDVKNLFVKKVERVRFGILVPQEKKLASEHEQTQAPNEKKAASKEVKAESTNFSAKISEKEELKTIPLTFLNYTGGGYIGEPEFRNRVPKYLSKLTLENGDPLPLNPDDICLEFKISSENFLGESSIYLPSMLFEGKNTGDKVRLRYEGKLVEFPIEEYKFDQSLKIAQTYNKAGERKLLFNTDPYWWRKLDSKAFQFAVNDTGEFVLHEIDKSQAFAGFKKPEFTQVDLYMQKDGILFLMDQRMRMKIPEDFQIILNKEYLIFYFKDDNFPSYRLFSLRRDNSSEKKDAFENLNVDNLEKQLKNAKLTCHAGQIQIFLPKLEQ